MTDELPREPGQVRDTYDEIAPHFSKTRHSPWPEVERFLEDVAPGHVGLDVGCGNGRHLPLLLDRVTRAVGLDVSRGMISEARTQIRPDDTVGLILADATVLPVGSDVVDVGLSIATVHHLQNREARLDHLRELGRVLAPEGRALVSAWSTTHDRFDEPEGFDTSIDWTLPDGDTVPRFYHIYAPEEFLADVESAALNVCEHYVSKGNCYAEVRP